MTDHPPWGSHAFTATDLHAFPAEETYEGAASFLRRPWRSQLDGLDVAIAGVLFDLAVTNRPGDRFRGFEAHDMPADLVTLGKPIANGLPCGGVVTTPDILEAFTSRIDFFSTFGGNPVACAAGLAVLEVLRDESLQANAERTGRLLLEDLSALMQGHALVGDVRGRGLMIGVELVTDRETKTPAAAHKRRVLDGTRERGVLIGSDGPHDKVLKIRPPMPFDASHAERLVTTLDEVLAGMSVPGFAR